MTRINAFTLHNDRGQAVLSTEIGAWMKRSGGFEIFGPVIRYSWSVDGIEYERWDTMSSISLHELPDANGFIGIEYDKSKRPDNCVLLDVNGNERIRLIVPWRLTNLQNPESANSPTHFARIEDPCINPANGTLGEFGVAAWVEYAGLYYFELNYRTGQFLWGRKIRD